MVENKFLEFLEETGNIKIVIGNGFDLQCGIHTKYSDYYCKNWKKYTNIQRIIKSFNSAVNFDYLDFEPSLYNLWDVFFAMNSPDDPTKCEKNWCEIEKLILSSLMSKKEIIQNANNKEIGSLSLIHWPELKRYMSKKSTISEILPEESNNRFMVLLLRRLMNGKAYSSDKYYDLILEQLKEFEKDFGKFVGEQIKKYDVNCMQPTINLIYYQKVDDLLNDLCPGDSTIRVDSFNYSVFVGDTRNVILNNINGSSSDPIFGVDSRFEPNDPRYIFTKTSRRLESEIFYHSYRSETRYNNLVVYGHSLDEADYSYYFPIFDKLKLLDNNASGRIVFAFSIYEEKKERSIKSALRKSVSQLFFNYAKDNQIPNPSRFLDSISTQKRVLFYEVKDVFGDRYKNRFDPFEEEWKKMINQMKAELAITKSKT